MTNPNPTVEFRLPKKIEKLVPKASITKDSKTYLVVEADYLTIEKIQGKVAEAAKAEGVNKTEAKRLADAKKSLKEAHKAAVEAASDVSALELEAHPLADVLPMMDKKASADLAKSMKDQGYLAEYPIILYENKILDGRNRYAAAKKAGVTPTFKQYKGNDPVGFVMTNIHRRHLNDDQRAAISGELKGLDSDTDGARSALNISASRAARGQRVAKASDVLTDAVKSGSLKLAEAEAILDTPKAMAVVEKKGAKADLKSLVPEKQDARKLQAVRLPLEGQDAYTKADVLYDANGEILGEGYWRPLPVDIADIETDPLIEKIGAVVDHAPDKAAIRQAIKALTDDELQALFLEFEGVRQPESLSNAKRNTKVVEHLMDWMESTGEEDEPEEADDEDYEEEDEDFEQDD